MTLRDPGWQAPTFEPSAGFYPVSVTGKQLGPGVLATPPAPMENP